MSTVAHVRFGWLAASLIAVTAVAAAQQREAKEGGTDRTAAVTVPEAVRLAMQDRQYGPAVVAIDKALAEKRGQGDYLTYLKGRALHYDGKYDDAIPAFDAVSKNFPDSPWARRARFAKGVSLARKGDFRAAEHVYRNEAKALLSLDRKQQIADIYLEYADAFFDPPEEDTEPDYAKAAEFYEQALEVGPQPESATVIQLQLARCAQELDDHRKAAQQYETFIEEHRDHPLAIEARYRTGECQLALKEPVNARRSWQDLLSIHQGGKSSRLPEAAYKLSLTFNIPQPHDSEELDLGVAALRSFIAAYPDHELASEAHLRIAESYQHRGRYEDAVTGLKQFLSDKRYAASEQIPRARNLLGQAYKRQRKFDEALAAWQVFLGKHPTDEAWSQVQREIINTEYLKAAEQYEQKNYEQARALWKEFLVRYPLDTRGRRILYLFGMMQFRQEKWEAAIADWERLVSKYPKTDESAQAQYMIAVTLEEKLARLEDALKQYEQVKRGDYEERAQRRINRLTAKNLTVATERIFRSDETPKLTLATRNIESVTVRQYRVDLETYFRKMHQADGVEGLDIALINPDRTFEFPVPDYQEYRQIECEIPVPLSQPGDAAPHRGVMAVTVSSKMFEATTLILQSDLDVIVKSSRDEVFVFAENMLTGKPWAGAQVLISDGKTVFAEGATGVDGVLHKSFEELEPADDVRVFAVADGNVASNVVGLNGVALAQGLSDRGYIYTDRPAYRAGQMVHIRGVLRKVAHDTYTVAAGKKYQLEVYDNRSRLVRYDEVTLNDFGSFHSHLMLPVSAPQGTYRISVFDDKEESYEGTFVVHEYRLEPVRIEIDTPRSVYYRGESIEGTIRTSFYFGAPLTGREVRYQLAGGPTVTEKTDDRGEVYFSFPTRDYRESQTLSLTVELAERNLRSAKTFFLATQGFTIQAGTVRPVYLAGEKFELTIETRDAEGKPISKPLTLRVLEQTRVGGQIGEVLAETHELTTAKNEGVVRQTLTLGKGGRYVLRLEGTDRFGNPVSGEAFVQISDENDAVRLRLLADQHTFKVGDAPHLKLHWRNAPALTLITFEGARILDYRLVQLKPGWNDFTVPMTPQLAPNFRLGVAVMTDPRAVAGPDNQDHERHRGDDTPPRRFHTASGYFTVERDLRVTLAVQPKGAGQARAEPGGEIEVTVTTTDPQGRPAAAEVSLALVEQALLSQFASPLETIGGYFRGLNREPAVRTSSSITFNYRPTTHPINVRLLAEAERLAVREEEAKRVAALRGAGGAFGGTRLSLVVSQSQEVHERFAEDIEADFDDEMDLFLEQVEDEKDQLLLAAESDVVPVTWSGVASVDRSSIPFDDTTGQFMFGIGVNADAGLTGTLVVGERNFTVTSVVPVLQDDGSWSNIHLGRQLGGKWDAEQAKALVEDLNKQGAVLLPHLPPHETAYWNPAVATGEDGTATLMVTLPERSTAWQLLAKGVTVDTLAGEASAELAVKKDLFGQLKLPASFTDGDQAQVTASIHNDVVEKGEISATLTTTIGDKSTAQTKRLAVEKKGLHDVAFSVSVELPELAKETGGSGSTVSFELKVATADGKHQDVVRRNVPIRPFGMPVFAVAGGTAESDAMAFVEPPEGMTLASPRLQVVLGPTVERSLLDVVFAAAPGCQWETVQLAATGETAVSNLMASLALQRLVGASREAASPQMGSLDERIRSSLRLLLSMQNDDGGWSWTGRGGKSNPYSTARVVWALHLAKQAGYRLSDNARNRAVHYVENRLSETRLTDFETKSILLHALCVADQEDFPLANQLYRNRNDLSTAGLLHLTLAFVEMDRKQTAGELLAVLATRGFAATDTEHRAGASSLSLCRAEAELRSLYALALDTVAPTDARLKEQIDWLMSHRTGHRWSPEKATGLAMQAVCSWYARTKFTAQKYRLTIFVNDLKVSEIDIDADSPTQTVDVPAELLAKKGRQRIRFEITGRGRYTYQCILGGFVPADKLKSTTANWRVERFHEPALLQWEGSPVPRGFGCLVDESLLLDEFTSKYRNELTQLPVGRGGRVELRVVREYRPDATRVEQLEYLVVTEPLPAGTTVVEPSVRGGFERFEISPGAMTFYIGNRRNAQIHYEILGYSPGQYRAAPAVVRNAHAPDQMAVSQPKSLTVLPLGKESTDKYRLTPQELFELGKKLFEKGEWKKAGTHLTDLLTHWNLDPEHYEKVVHMLLDIHLEIGPPSEVVRYFETVIEKYPEEEIPFATSMKVGDAYDQIGEYERSYLVFRGTVEGSFQRESQVAGFLQAEDEYLRSVEVMSSLLREYPPEAYVAEATYALAQRVYAKAPETATDERLREKELTRVDLIRQALDMLDGFLTAYPEDPAADEASFSLATGLLELELYDETIAACDRYAKRFADSDFLDSFWYIIGYCRYARSEHEQALAMCDKVARHKYRDQRSGREEESPNKWRAIYILGQIRHSLGQAAAAIAEYERVKDRFADARQAIEYFARKDIRLPEVTRCQPGEAVEVELTYRNIPSCDVKVYQIDLMKFSLLKRNLGGITRINLAGISPSHEETVALGDGKDYRDCQAKLALPLEDQGAYLVVCRGEDLHTSGLVLISPLKIEVREDTVSGRVRTTVQDAVTDAYVPNVHVKVIGSGNRDFISGETDLRGIFIADAIRGTTTVIAQTDQTRFAFHRGTQSLGTSDEQSEHPVADPFGEDRSAAGADPFGTDGTMAEPGAAENELLEGLRDSNETIQSKQQELLDKLYNNTNSGGFGGGGFF